MLRFIMQKMLSKKWMTVSLLIGNILFVSILCSITMYSEAVQQRVMHRKMNSKIEEVGEYPMKLTLNSSLTVVSKSRHNGDLFAETEQMAADFGKLSGVGYKEFIKHCNLIANASPKITRNGKKLTLKLQLGFLSNMEEHVEMVSGSLYSDITEEGIIPVIVSEKMLSSQRLILGEVLELTKIKDSNGNPVQVSINGVFKNSDPYDTYWVKSPSEYDNMMFMSQKLFTEMFVNYSAPTYPMRGTWYLLLDYKNMDLTQIPQVNEVTSEYKSFVEQQTAVTMEENYLQGLSEFMQEDDKVSTTMWILQAPILVLLIAFISMVSKQMLALEETEIAVYKSRGISKKQILKIYIGQSLIIGVIASIVGVFLGVFLCQLLGSANAFLEFVGREALQIKIFSAEIFRNCLLAIVITTIVTMIPVISYADTSIVGHRQKKGKKHDTVFWQRFGLDFFVLLVSCYGYYSYSKKEEILMLQVLAGEGLDPLLYLSSSLFMIGAGLVMIRVIHFIVRIVFRFGRSYWNLAMYTSFTRIIRSRNQQNFMIVFMILTIGLGIHNAQTARTVNANDENNIMYRVGANVVLQEKWIDNSKIVEADPTGTLSLAYQEPDFNKYLNIEGVVSAAKVYVGTAATEKNNRVILMGIDTKEFGETAWFYDELLVGHWYHYLNAMSDSPYGIVVSESFRLEGGYQLGDTLYYTMDGIQTWGIICGFVDYWPSFIPTRIDSYRDVEYMIPNFLIVANRTQIESLRGILPYKVYLKTDGNTENVYQYILNNHIDLMEYTDANQIIVDHKNNAILQGTNGMLTVGFITILLLCIIGYMIYWILSMKSRTLQFGVLRAMGMTIQDVIVMLMNEQFFITALSVIAGVVIGLTASKLFVPLIQIAYANEENILTLTVVSDTADTYRVLIVVIFMIIISICILGKLISRTGIAQALKLGED